MAYNFNFDENTPVERTGSSRMRPWEIHKDVVLDKLEIVSGTAKESETPWKALDIIFKNPAGQEYRERIFYPRDMAKAMERHDGSPATDKNGNTFTPQLPSNWERIKTCLGMIMNAIDPNIYKKYQTYSSKFTSFDNVVEVFVKLMDTPAVKSTKVELLLVGKTQDGYVNAALPNFVRINREGKAYVAENFIGHNLAFSQWEKKQKEAYENSTPSNPEAASTAQPVVNNSASTSDDELQKMMAAL